MITDKLIQQLGRTTWNQATKVVIYDTMVRCGGSANCDFIYNEVQRRLVEPLDHHLMTQFDEYTIAGIYTSMARDNYWIRSDGWGTWSFVDGGRSDIKDYFNSRPRNFGFESADELLDLLDLVTEPYDPNPKNDLEPFDQIIEQMKQTLDNFAEQVEKIAASI